ncbi:SF3a splicing factor complex subunit [Coemansia sp. RSA 989]|nr:SF3a splicing factor complex subunit [Coemansia sp. RSA 989]
MVAVYNYNYVAKFIVIGDMGCGKSSLLRQFTEGAFVLYDITNRESFESLDRWLADARQLTPAKSIFVLVGNKADRESQREVSESDGELYAKQNGMLFVEASAKTGEKVDAIFLDLATQIVSLVRSGEVNPASPDSGVQCTKPQTFRSSSSAAAGTGSRSHILKSVIMEEANAAESTSIIYPPLDIKTIVDKTAERVAKAGEAFEQLIREKYQGNVKFSFINPNDPYYAYYEHMVEQYRSGKTIASGNAEPLGDMADIAMAADHGTPEQNDTAPEPPEPFKFAAMLPAISAQDLDVIKLTAQFVARNGRKFMTSLAQRESSNYQFDFLSPQHSLFEYFRSLVDQYTLAFFPPKDLHERMQQDVKDKYQILERAKRRMEWEAFEEQERKQKAEEAEKEKEAFLSIDWHDFVVVGAVEFVEEDAYAELPPPIRLQDLKNMSLEEKHKAKGTFAVEPPAPMPQKVQEEDVEMDMEEDEVEEIEAEPKPVARAPPAALGIGPMKIRKDYKPNLRRGPQVEVSLQCQLCKMEIPASEFEEHIRVELIDPKWKEQKLAYERKIRDSNLVQEGMDIARYLKQLAQHRGGPNAEEQTAGLPQNRVYWDGYSATAQKVTRQARENMSAEDHLVAQRIKQGLPDPRDTRPKIGPQMPQTTPASKRHKK